jgi:hypothetical protein
VRAASTREFSPGVWQLIFTALVQERAIKLAMADSATDGKALAVLASGLAEGGGVSREALLEFADRFEADGQWSNAAHVLIGALLSLVEVTPELSTLFAAKQSTLQQL